MSNTNKYVQSKLGLGLSLFFFITTGIFVYLWLQGPYIIKKPQKSFNFNGSMVGIIIDPTGVEEIYSVIQIISATLQTIACSADIDKFKESIVNELKKTYKTELKCSEIKEKFDKGIVEAQTQLTITPGIIELIQLLFDTIYNALCTNNETITVDDLILFISKIVDSLCPTDALANANPIAGISLSDLNKTDDVIEGLIRYGNPREEEAEREAQAQAMMEAEQGP